MNRTSLSMVAACDLIDAIVKADQVMDPPTWDVFSDLLTRDENPFPAAKALQVALDTTSEPAEHTAADIGVLGAAAAIRKTRTTARKPRRTVTP